MASACKICVIGPPATGKSLFCKIVANQALFPNARYDPTEASFVRIQRYQCSAVAGQKTSVQLWDCSGAASTLEHARALAEGADGIVLVCNANKLTHERELEQVYKEFVQPLDLPKQQCVVLSLNVASGHSVGTGLTGRLAALPQKQIDIDPQTPSGSQPLLAQFIDELVAKCVARQNQQAEDDVIDGTDS